MCTSSDGDRSERSGGLAEASAATTGASLGVALARSRSSRRCGLRRGLPRTDPCRPPTTPLCAPRGHPEEDHAGDTWRAHASFLPHTSRVRGLTSASGPWRQGSRRPSPLTATACDTAGRVRDASTCPETPTSPHATRGARASIDNAGAHATIRAHRRRVCAAASAVAVEHPSVVDLS